MSLDIAILGADKTPKKQVSIGVDDHFRLMQLVDERCDSLVARMKDYYADAEFENAELDDLVGEATVLRKRCSEDERLVSLLNALIELAEEAKLEQTSLIAIAD